MQEVVARENGREREGRVHATRKVPQGRSITAITPLRAQSSERTAQIPVEELSIRLDRIESVIEATAIEVERISEANRFMAKLLAERVNPLPLPSKPERVITPH